MLTIITIIILLVIFYIIYKKMTNKSDTQTEQSTQETKQNTPIDVLLDLNILIRIRLKHMEHIVYIETIIDKLKSIIPILNEEYKSHELTWSVNKMATDYLPKLIYPYSKLSEEQQIVKEDVLLKSLKNIEEQLDETIEMVNAKDETQFDKKAKFIDHRFSDKF
jgi:heme/copper-type cytochrome/quinol oxidase subunit 2